MIHPIVMAGGRGERFWPYSNAKHPKQLLPLVTEKTMLEDTLDNLRKFKKGIKVRLIIGKNLEKPVKQLVGKRPGIEIVAEPVGRNTAAAVALAARLISRVDPKGVMLVLTADHAIGPAAKFAQAMRAASSLAEAGDSLVTFGIQPDRPEVGFGYIEVDSALAGSGSRPEKSGVQKVEGLSAYTVKRFVEKPDLATAKEYVDSGKFFWNSGMFAWRVDYLWEQFRKHQPKIAEIFEAAGDLNPKSPSFATKLKKIYKAVPEISIDNGIMEKADRIRVVVPEFSWDDIGSWAALERLHKPDAEANRKIGSVVTLDANGNTLFAEEGMIAAFGVSDLLIVQTGGVTLVLPKDKAARLKEIVKLVQKEKRLAEFV
jgi:mannose-1-phosphate guanylyltransferase